MAPEVSFEGARVLFGMTTQQIPQPAGKP